ncbi:MAG: pyridoxamine 5'-phosphate oxidase family protein [Gemmatimonadetes bacterium]|nr:pyridoxamine 5'-phosphate oxidase family protein [Gemmatimonadota bacterium]
MTVSSIYHAGELLAQQRTGEEMQAEHNAGVISDRIIPGAIPFIAQQSMVVLGTVDADQNVWASVLFGRPGFMSAADDRTVDFEVSRAGYAEHDPLWTNIAGDPRVGMLAIEFATRRRLRINGNLSRVSDDKLRLDVREAYANCPKYIQRRHFTRLSGDPGQRVAPRSGDVLSTSQRASIGAADTFFVASAHSEGGGDVSHRGGNSGFVEILDDRTLRIPDYAGNSMFNTLGNFVTNPRAGLLFIDFEANRTLQLLGTPEIRWELDEPHDHTGGTRRYWDFTVEHWLERELTDRVEWELLDYSPFNP